MKNMKREFKLLLTILLLLFTGWILNYVLVSSKQDETKKISEELEEKKAQLSRDDYILQKVNLTRELYAPNIKSSDNFNLVNADFTEKLQNLLTVSSIKFNSNDILPVNSTSESIENGLAFYSFDISFTSEYKDFIKFIKNLEKDKLFFDVVNFTITKQKNESVVPVAEGGEVAQAPQPVTKTGVVVTMRIQITKFI